MTTSRQAGGHGVRQNYAAETAGAPIASPSPYQSPTFPPALLTDEQAAQCMGISRRTFRQLQGHPWMPKAIVLGPRLVRWSRAELEQAVAVMPRQQDLSEPAQLRRSRIEGMKRGGFQ